MMSVNQDGIPSVLKTEPHWILWKLEKGDKRKDSTYGKDKKVPYSLNGNRAKSNDPSTWGAFNVIYAEYLKGKYSGIGFVFTDTNYVAIDIDYLVNDEKSQEIIDLFSGTYCEESPSGKLHAFCIGAAQRTGKGTDDKLFEIYDSSSPRYMSITGHHIEGTAADLTEQQAQLNTLHEIHFKAKPPQVKGGQPITTVDTSINIDDTRIIEIAGKAMNQDKFNALYYGDGLTDDESSNDLSLCNLLAFYTKEPNQIDRIFRGSMRMRDKWNNPHYSGGETYGVHTINKAITGCTGSYRNKPPDVLSVIPATAIKAVSAMNMHEPSFSLAKFSLKGQAEKMKEKMLAEIHVMKNIALLGQITVIYAKPNTGKTLLTVYLIKESVLNNVISGDDVFYVNADDSYNGLIEKTALAEQYGFHMIAPAHNGFEVKDLTAHMQTMINQDGAKGKIIILDTLKKFADLMDKKSSTQFMNTARAFALKGGTLILLAHTNKNRDSSGKVVTGGTSDIVDDGDCAYTLDEISAGNDIKTVLFENIKLRGNVAREIGFAYSTANNQTYEQRLNSVTILDDDSTQHQKQSLAVVSALEKDTPVIDAITKVLSQSDQLKTDLVAAVHSSQRFPVRQVRDILERYEQDKWQLLPSGKNSKKYTLRGKSLEI